MYNLLVDTIQNKHFNTSNTLFRVTIVAICLVIVTFAILSLGISLVLFRHCGKNVHTELRCEVSHQWFDEFFLKNTYASVFSILWINYFPQISHLWSLIICQKCSVCTLLNMNFAFQASTEEEVLELVPHITLNPSFNIDMLEYIEAEVSPTGKKKFLLW